MTKTQGKRALVASQPAAEIAAARARWDQAARAYVAAVAEIDRLDDEITLADNASDIQPPLELFRMEVGRNGRRAPGFFHSEEAIRNYYEAIAKKLQVEVHPRMMPTLALYARHRDAENAAAAQVGYPALVAARDAACDTLKEAREALIQTPAMDADGLALKIRAVALNIPGVLDPGLPDHLAAMMGDAEQWGEGLALAGIYLDALRLAGRDSEAKALAASAASEAAVSQARLEAFRATQKAADPSLADEDGFSVAAWVAAFREAGGEVYAPPGAGEWVSRPFDGPDNGARADALYRELLSDPSKAEAVHFFVKKGLV